MTTLVNKTHLEQRVQAFRADLAATEISDVIRKHITTGDPAALSTEDYFLLRKKISEQFKIYPSSIVLVGSCKLGFSLKAKRDGRYKLISNSSDVDVAVVSDTLFDSYWNKVFDLVQENRNWAIDEGKKFSRDLFCGWLNPESLPNLPRFKDARDWAEFFAQMTSERICGYRAIKARIYRTWDRLEAYQKIMVSECKSEIGRLQ